MVEQTQVRMTAAEFSQLPETSGFMELINGEVIVSPSPRSQHQGIVLNLAILVRQLRPDGMTRVAPMDVYLDEVNVFQPDVFWVAPESRCVLRDGYFYGPPELVVEVFSPSTSTRDKREKFATYQQHGVSEYWLVDPVGEHMEVWQRAGDAFSRKGVYTEGENFPSTALGKDVTLKGIFESNNSEQDNG